MHSRIRVQSQDRAWFLLRQVAERCTWNFYNLSPLSWLHLSIILSSCWQGYTPKVTHAHSGRVYASTQVGPWTLLQPNCLVALMTRAIKRRAVHVAESLSAMLVGDMEDKPNAQNVLHRCLCPEWWGVLSIHSFCHQLRELTLRKWDGLGPVVQRLAAMTFVLIPWKLTLTKMFTSMFAIVIAWYQARIGIRCQ